jgi:hypothetical protein
MPDDRQSRGTAPGDRVIDMQRAPVAERQVEFFHVHGVISREGGGIRHASDDARSASSSERIGYIGGST